jgi:hypothetical protein
MANTAFISPSQVLLQYLLALEMLGLDCPAEKSAPCRQKDEGGCESECSIS